MQSLFSSASKQSKIETKVERVAEPVIAVEEKDRATWSGPEYTAVPTTAEFIEDAGAIRLSEDEDEFATGSLPQFTLSPSSSQVLTVSRRRSRTALILAIPMLMVALHIISSRLGFGYESMYSSLGQDSEAP